jgi:hypothetical protein
MYSVSGTEITFFEIVLHVYTFVFKKVFSILALGVKNVDQAKFNLDYTPET